MPATSKLSAERRKLKKHRTYTNLVNTAVCEGQTGNIDSAVALLREAIGMDCTRPEVWNNLGQCASDLGQFDQAPFYFQRALQCIEKSGTPISAARNTLLAFAYSMMRLGQFEYIWPVWESARIGSSWHPFPGIPVWDGKPTANLLVVPEGGYGDGFCFLRWIKHMAQAYLAWADFGGPQWKGPRWRATLLIWPALFEFSKKVLGDRAPGTTVLPLTYEFRHGELSQFSACTSILSFPAMLPMQSWDYIPPPLEWQPRGYFELGHPLDRIGFCWRAEENGSSRPIRSLSREAADAIGRKLGAKGAEVISLCPRTANLIKPADGEAERFFPARTHQDDAALADWESTAVTILHCKLVVTVDTAVAHLAGSLGVPTLCLLPLRSDWKWGTADKPCPPWYGSKFQIFRNQNPLTWDIDRIKEALEPML